MTSAPRRFVYVIRSVSHPARQYVGLTADVTSRLKSHNAGESPQTARFRPWQLVVACAFADDQRATAFEKFLKSATGRAFTARHFS